MSETPRSLADQMFDAYLKYVTLEEEAHDAVMQALGIDPDEPNGWPHSDFAHDYYDASYELLDANPAWTPTPEQIRATFALGFDRCWICYRDGTEAAYGARDPRPESEWGQRKPSSRATADPRVTPNQQSVPPTGAPAPEEP